MWGMRILYKFCTGSGSNNKTTKHRPFELSSKCRRRGIDFKVFAFTALDIADAFTRDIIPGYIDWPIKQNALLRADQLVSGIAVRGRRAYKRRGLLAERVFDILDDFLFMGLLSTLVQVRWLIPNPRDSNESPLLGQTLMSDEAQGRYLVIEILKPNSQEYKSSEEWVTTLLHEMCHALFCLACCCQTCSCLLNQMNAAGLTGHGPCWRRVASAAEETAKKYLGSIFRDWSLITPVEMHKEDYARLRLLKGLAAKVERENDAGERSKRVQRREKYLADYHNSPEGYARLEEENQLLADVCAMFMQAESNFDCCINPRVTSYGLFYAWKNWMTM